MIFTASAAYGCSASPAHAASAQEDARVADSQPASQPAFDTAASQPAESDAEPGPLPARPSRPFFRFEELTLDVGFDAEWQSRQTLTDTYAPTLFPCAVPANLIR